MVRFIYFKKVIDIGDVPMFIHLADGCYPYMLLLHMLVSLTSVLFKKCFHWGFEVGTLPSLYSIV